MHANKHVEDWLQVIRGEFDEVPALTLTLSEARRRWELDEGLLEPMLDALVDVGFLRALPDGGYERRGGRGSSRDAVAQRMQ